MSSQDFSQIIPDSVCMDGRVSHHTALQDALLSRTTNWPRNRYQVFSAYPIFTPPSRIQELRSVHSALQAVLPAIVRRWWSRPDLQSMIPMSERIERVIRQLDNERPYDRVGCIRPDFLVPEDPQEPLKVCEINARFMFNGFIVGTWAGDSIQEVGILPEGCTLSAATFEEMCNAYWTLIDPEKPVGLVTHRERNLGKASDSLFFEYVHSQTRLVNPANLRLVPSSSSPTGVTLSDDIGVLDQFVLELHQEEIEELDEDILLQLGRTCWNDLRTIYFAHDKRLLGIIQREADWLVEMGDITMSQAETLRNSFAETYISGDPMYQFLIESTDPTEKNNWTLKASMAGKGEGMLFGKDLSEKEWKDTLKVVGVDSKIAESDQFNSDNGRSCEIDTRNFQNNVSKHEMMLELARQQPYILQRYVKQKKLNLTIRNPALPTPTIMNVRWCAIGTMLCISEYFLGVTPWRASGDDIVAVGRGGVILPGATTSGESFTVGNTTSTPSSIPTASPNISHGEPRYLDVPPEARITAPSLETFENQVKPAREALEKYGLAVVHLSFDDPKSTYMISLTDSLGKPHAHSSSHGILWDVKPVEGIDTERAARSETMGCFPWHTDCSFEHSPPRYLGLHVIRSDRLGGGKLRLVRSDSIISRLDDSSLASLQSPLYRIDVPKEFHKGIDHIIGPIVSSDGQRKLRYRRDIIQPLTEEAGKALAALDDIFATLGEDEEVVGDDVMSDGTVILVDNARLLHARTRISDPNRWLRRVRWGQEVFV
ncbi:hypothetical protein K440DRAFT_605498 [Wilcoxina mikolae CBS 423.85]|nr:hypothetical protein K440DRAFT_605498 [Wilcoxina mikolae CBS 423.85]